MTANFAGLSPLAPQPEGNPPLTGLRVIDFTRVVAGPFGTQILGDLGAEVIKIENPQGGDDSRHVHRGPDRRGETTMFLSLNRSKRSVCVDLKSEEGRQVILDLLAVLFFMRFRARPGHFFGMIGLGMGGISGLMFLWLMIVKFGYGEDIGTRPLLTVAMMLFIGSVQMITTGILAEMLARSDNARLGYSIRKIHGADD